MNIKEIIEKLKEKQAESRIVPEEADPRVRAGVEAIVRNAKVAVEEVEEQYKTAIIGHTVIIAVSGEKSSEFAEIASTKLKTLSVDFKAVLKRLLANLKNRNAGKLYSQHEHFLLLDEFNRLKLELRVQQLPPPRIERYNDGIYESELNSAVEKLLKKNYENSLYSVVARKEIGALALQSEFVGKYLPVVLYNYEAPVDINFLPTPIIEVDAGDKVTEKMVRSIMNEVRSKLVGNKNNDPDMGNNEGESNE